MGIGQYRSPGNPGLEASCKWTWSRALSARRGRAVTAISPLTRSLDGAATLFRTRPLPCHHPLNSNWDGSLISTRSHWRICSRTTEANASRFSAQIAKRWEPGLASDGNYRIHVSGALGRAPNNQP